MAAAEEEAADIVAAAAAVDATAAEVIRVTIADKLDIFHGNDY
jgi:hypothetical protein